MPVMMGMILDSTFYFLSHLTFFLFELNLVDGNMYDMYSTYIHIQKTR